VGGRKRARRRGRESESARVMDGAFCTLNSEPQGGGKRVQASGREGGRERVRRGGEGRKDRPGKRYHSLPTQTVRGASRMPHERAYPGNKAPTLGHTCMGAAQGARPGVSKPCHKPSACARARARGSRSRARAHALSVLCVCARARRGASVAVTCERHGKRDHAGRAEGAAGREHSRHDHTLRAAAGAGPQAQSGGKKSSRHGCGICQGYAGCRCCSQIRLGQGRVGYGKVG